MPVQSQDHARGQVTALLRGTFHRRRPSDADTHLFLAGEMAACIWHRYDVGPFGWEAKHLRWFLTEATQDLSALDRQAYYATGRIVGEALGRWAAWERKIRWEAVELEQGRGEASSSEGMAREDAELLVQQGECPGAPGVAVHTFAAGEIARCIWLKFNLSPDQWQANHIRWFFETAADALPDSDRSAYIQAIQRLGSRLGRWRAWNIAQFSSLSRSNVRAF
ncbi:hypothetical protein [Azospirillum sp. SYSU D00513]|uniref:hypothetical protein n=1 Tax=Azospirillum sp. SYSU D00513 TaxID=2812561 RepID=UPI001A97AF11|nr:hypothetical protein [Azospirillum sp. SYSU D00513]